MMKETTMQDLEMPTQMPVYDMDIALTKYADYIISKAPHTTQPRPGYSKPYFSFESGSKYIRAVKLDGSSRSAYAFIVLRNTDKFLVGDILKPASWKTPATNLARGNVLRPHTYQYHSYYGL
jgi:hypothetical protein